MNPVYYYQVPVVYQTPEPPEEKNGAATASLVMGILSLVFLFCCPFLTPVFSLIGIITAVASKSKSSAGKMNGRAVGGLVMRIIGLVLGILSIIAVRIFLAPAGIYVIDQLILQMS